MLFQQTISFIMLQKTLADFQGFPAETHAMDSQPRAVCPTWYVPLTLDCETSIGTSSSYEMLESYG